MRVHLQTYSYNSNICGSTEITNQLINKKFREHCAAIPHPVLFWWRNICLIINFFRILLPSKCFIQAGYKRFLTDIDVVTSELYKHFTVQFFKQQIHKIITILAFNQIWLLRLHHHFWTIFHYIFTKFFDKY